VEKDEVASRGDSFQEPDRQLTNGVVAVVTDSGEDEPHHDARVEIDYHHPPALTGCRDRPEARDHCVGVAEEVLMPEIVTLNALFEDELRDVYDAETQIVRVLPKLIAVISADQLRAMLETHLEETLDQIERLDRVFVSLELRAGGTYCLGMAGILDEAVELMEEGGHTAVLDAGYIAAARQVKHYEITSYGSLIAWAEILGYTVALPLLQANEREERAAATALGHLAESMINLQAAAADPEANTANLLGTK
jgi:ferritin-like metal-binding protein YciE